MQPVQYRNLSREFTTVTDAMNRVFARDFRPYDFARNGGNAGNPGEANGEGKDVTSRLPVDVWSNENEFFVSAYVPSVKPEDVEITFEGDSLTIRGKFEPAAEDVTFARRELYRGAFERQITFNVPVNADAIEAEYENGVLKLRVPKAEVAKPKQIKVVAR